MFHSRDFSPPAACVPTGNMYIFSGKVHPPQQAAPRGDPARGCRLVGQLAPALVPTSPDNRGWWPLHYAPLLWGPNTVP